MRKYTAVFILWIFIVSCSVKYSAGSADVLSKYSPEDLPALILAYSLAVKQYDQFRCLWELNGKDKYKHPFPLLETTFNKISPNINVSLGFTHNTSIVQNQVKGQIYGLSPQENIGKDKLAVPLENILFITTPIESFGKRCLIFLSSVKPECTTIFAIDKDLNVEQLYNTFDNSLNRIREKDIFTIMCSIFSIRVREPGVFILSERENNKCAMPGEIRTFKVDVAKGKFRISLDNVKP